MINARDYVVEIWMVLILIGIAYAVYARYRTIKFST